MAITSFIYILFYMIVLIIYYIIPQKAKAPFLTISSLFFYGCWAVWAPFFMLSYTFLIYFAARFMSKRNKKIQQLVFLYFIIIACISIYLLMRYTDWVSRIVSWLAYSNRKNISIIFPLGLSYYMFKSISYLIDIYYEKILPEKRFDYLLLHFSLFTEITMGPISRAADFLPQIRHEKHLDPQNIYQSFFFMLWGYVKKLVIADHIMVYLIQYTSASALTNGLAWLLIALLYLMQLYLDFSGYSDISIAASNAFGYEIKPNFQAPFLSKTLSEIWHRWHMSLSHFLGDYVFTPIQLNARFLGIGASVIATLITMVLSGLWHGISWKFLIFGLSFGSIMALDILLAKQRKRFFKKIPKKANSIFSIIITILLFSLLCVAMWAPNIQDTLKIVFSYILNPTTWFAPLGLSKSFFLAYFPGIIFVIISHKIELDKKIFITYFFKKTLVIRWIIYLILLFVIILFQTQGADFSKGFVYEQF